MFTIVAIMLPICLVTMICEIAQGLIEKIRERKSMSFLR